MLGDSDGTLAGLKITWLSGWQTFHREDYISGP